jgi:hypothetical protein
MFCAGDQRAGSPVSGDALTGRSSPLGPVSGGRDGQEAEQNRAGCRAPRRHQHSISRPPGQRAFGDTAVTNICDASRRARCCSPPDERRPCSARLFPFLDASFGARRMPFAKDLMSSHGQRRTIQLGKWIIRPFLPRLSGSRRRLISQRPNPWFVTVRSAWRRVRSQSPRPRTLDLAKRPNRPGSASTRNLGRGATPLPSVLLHPISKNA